MPKKEKANHSSGNYRYSIKIKLPTGETKQKVFYSKKSKLDAKRKAEEWRTTEEIKRRTGIVPSDVSSEPFDRWARKWLSAYKQGKVKEHTFNFTYRSIVEKYIIPYFGSCPIQRIMQVDLQKYLNEVCQPDGKPLAKSTLQKHILILYEIFETAEENMLIQRNPAKNLKVPSDSSPAQERQYWSLKAAEQAENWVKAYISPHPTHEGYNGAEGILIILETGVRRSELLALEWDDVWWQENLIHVQRAVVPTTGKIVLGGTKSQTSDRYIPVSDSFLEWLKKLPRYGKYIIPGQTEDQPRSPNGWASAFPAIMGRLARDTGLIPLTPHELRHTYGTILREKGVDIYTISKVMGHASVSITESIYIHNDIQVLKSKMGVGINRNASNG